jgi:SAM-dependent methyltransferase/uncharacterized protein YbaR (Trm112 family)
VKTDVLPYLCCPACKADLSPVRDEMQGGQIARGALRCDGCATEYPIEHGVPSFVPQTDQQQVVQTTEGFARNWNAYNDVILEHAELNDELFRDWIAPLDPASFADEVVLEAGCGMGRWMHVAARYRPKALIGVDYSPVAYTAHANTASMDGVHVLRADIRRMPLKPLMDTIYCLGVVHHTPDPEASFGALAQAMADDGRMSVWVYGKENNEWITKLVDPLRKNVTSKLPHGLLALISKGLALEVYGAAWVYDRFFARTGFSYGAYLQHLRRYPFQYMEHIVYDHLVPEIAHYISREELEGWAARARLPFHLSARNDNSWRLLVAREQATLDRSLGRAPRSAAAE